MRWQMDDPLARRLVIGTLVAFLVVEVVATYAGQARDGKRRPFGAVAEALLLTRRRDGIPSQDRATLWVIALATRGAAAAAILIAADIPSLRAGANNWGTLAAGMAVAVAGTALRGWAIVTLGRHFRRVVTIEPGQTLIRAGPYRWLRHPSYAGLLLVYAGLGLALGSWVSAAAAPAILLVGLLPRIRVEEKALATAFPAEYPDYAGSTARVLPHVW